MATRPKPGDHDFVVRHPRLDLAVVRQRIQERRGAAFGHPMRAVLDADTDMMAALLRDVVNLRTANGILKEIVRARDPRGKGPE